MELKYLSREHVPMRQVSSNRTFMELKLWYQNQQNEKHQVLIVPLWN